MQLKAGRTTNDPRLDRVPEFDVRSRAFPIRTLVEAKLPRSYTWSVPVMLDQGNEGACCGFARTQELAARPRTHPWVTNHYARQLYLAAQEVDEWPGHDYSGTSVLAAAKVAVMLGHMKEYRWGFSLMDTILGIGYGGPGVFGTNWYTGMMRPDVDGRIRPTGVIEGGHSWLGRAVAIPIKRRPSGRVGGWNSWGQRVGWPQFWLTYDDLERLLHEQGEFCISVQRLKVAQST
jgi:hypothetical protein